MQDAAIPDTIRKAASIHPMRPAALTTSSTHMTDSDKSTDPKPPTLWQTVSSVAASFFGVQSSKNRQRDFSKGKAGHFIAIGLVMTVLVVLGVWLAVKFALRSAGM